MAKNQKLEQMKYEIANQVGVNLKEGYNGDLTSREAGTVGGQMVKDVTPVRIKIFNRNSRIAKGHKTTVKYIFGLAV